MIALSIALSTVGCSGAPSEDDVETDTDFLSEGAVENGGKKHTCNDEACAGTCKLCAAGNLLGWATTAALYTLKCCCASHGPLIVVGGLVSQWCLFGTVVGTSVPCSQHVCVHKPARCVRSCLCGLSDDDVDAEGNLKKDDDAVVTNAPTAITTDV